MLNKNKEPLALDCPKGVIIGGARMRARSPSFIEIVPKFMACYDR